MNLLTGIVASGLLIATIAPSPPPMGAIIPGVGVEGLFKLGSYSGALSLLRRDLQLPQLPRPTFQRFSDGKQIVEYTQYGVRLFVSRDQIDLIAIITSQIRVKGRPIPLLTSRGIGVGSSEKRAAEKYGMKPFNRVRGAGGEVWYYDCVGFDMSNDTHVVRAILIFPARDRGRCAEER